MKTCLYCKEDNREGSILCRYCGKPLHQTLVVHILHEVKNKPHLPPPPTEPELTLMVIINQGVKSITLPYGQKLTLGRKDLDHGTTPHIDLSEVGASELGVSRLHGVIDYVTDSPTIADLGSTNGTFLNGQRLMLDQPYMLSYGDELRLGKMVMYVYTSITN